MGIVDEHGVGRGATHGELFGADSYLDYVRTCGRYDSENRPARVEYSDNEYDPQPIIRPANHPCSPPKAAHGVCWRR